MFNVNFTDIKNILQDYNITNKFISFSELQRFHYERVDQQSKQVRLIVKIDFEDSASVVMRFKNETDVSIELIEKQSQFADMLKTNGIAVPAQYKTNGHFARWYCIGGYDVIVTIEDFVDNEIKIVDTAIAKATGKMLAKTHMISEQNDFHIDNAVLFNPFTQNDLFAYYDFSSLESFLSGRDKIIFDKITDKYNSYMELLTPLKNRTKYAVQGDISENNLFVTKSGEIGLFDFNRAGDNILFCDAVMQAVFYARLMDYPENVSEDYKNQILSAFWDGYCSVREFTTEEQQMYPYLYAIINAFWSMDIIWDENSLINAHKSSNSEIVSKCLETIWERLSCIVPMP